IMSKPKLLYEHATATIYSSIALGLSPIYIRKEAGKSVLAVNPRWSIIAGAYFSFYIVLVIILAGYSHMNFVTVVNNSYFVTLMLLTFTAKMGVNIFYPILCKYVIKSSLLKVLNVLTETTITLNWFGFKRHYWKDVLYQIFKVIIVPVTHIILYVIATISLGTAFNRSIPLSVFEIYNYLTVSLLNSQFTLLLIVVKQHFSAINKYLENLGNFCVDKSHERTVDTPKHHNVSEIKLMMFLYDKLCGSASTVTFMYSGIYLLSTTIIVGDLLVCVFYVEEMREGASVLFTVCACLSNAIKNFEMFYVSYVAEVTGNEAHATKRLVHKAILKTRDNLLIKEVIFSVEYNKDFALRVPMLL
ncbi:hypothetical protein ILUMI_08682, partial [Ignelater luminosus]